MANKQKSNVLAIIVMILLFGMISFVTNLASPMGDVLKNQFGVANWMGTLGVFANFIAYAIMGIPAGNMLQNMGYKKTALIAIGVGFAGVAIQTLSGFMVNGLILFGRSSCHVSFPRSFLIPTLYDFRHKMQRGIQVRAHFYRDTINYC